MQERRVTSPLLALSLASGVAGLLYETIWLRWFRLLFGSTAYAASATLCAFFVGLALGSYLFGRRAAGLRKPLRLYAGIEFAAALAALFVPLMVAAYQPLYGSVYESLAGHRGLFVGLKFALSLIAIVPAATLMGGTLPVLAAAYVGDEKDMGRRVGNLYALNTLGAAIGSAAGALWLPEVVGVWGAYSVALCLSLAVGAASWMLARRPDFIRSETVQKETEAESAPRPLLFVAFISGVGTLAFEVVLMHAIALSLQSSVYSFGAVLIVVLISLAGGSAIVAATANRIAAAPFLIVALLLEAFVLLVLPWAIDVASGGQTISRDPSFWRGILLAATMGGPALVVAGLVLPLTFRLAEGDGGVGPRIGGLLSANTVGGILGSVVASFVLLDWIGLWPSMATIGFIYLVPAVIASVAIAPRSAIDSRRFAPAAFCVAVLFGTVVFSSVSPFRVPVVHLAPQERLVGMAEGAHGLVTVTDTMTPNMKLDRRLRVDNDYVLSGSLAQRHQRRMGHIPLLLHPAPKRVMFIGSATGETSSSALAHPVEEIVLVELVPEVQDLAALHFKEANLGVYQDPRTRVIVEDGRNHVRGAPELYDVIVTDLLVPGRPGVGSMYSLEHFAAVRDHLSEGGVYAIWLPLYQQNLEEFKIISATFAQIFPEASVWRGDFFVGTPTAALIGINGKDPSRAEVERNLQAFSQAGDVEDAWMTEPYGFWSFCLGPLVGSVSFEGVALNTDNWPIFEYRAGRIEREQIDRFLNIGWPAVSASAIDAAQAGGGAFADRPIEAARVGMAMRELSVLSRLGEKGAAARRRIYIKERLPTILLDKPDVTVAEFWPVAVSSR